MTQELGLAERAAIARQQAKIHGLSQEALALLLDLTQPQISRMLSGKLRRETKAFSDLCGYLDGLPTRPGSERQLPEEIKSAALEIWDGTHSHARAISTVIRALSLLRRPR